MLFSVNNLKVTFPASFDTISSVSGQYQSTVDLNPHNFTYLWGPSSQLFIAFLFANFFSLSMTCGLDRLGK